MIDGDGYPENYQMMRVAVRHLKGVPGLTIEIGVRQGGGSTNIMEACIENGDQRIHIAVDPYGGLPYPIPNGGVADFVYPNQMKQQCMADLYLWCKDRSQELIFFTMEDTEFFNRFLDGIPYYDSGYKALLNQYALVMLDGVHTQEAVQSQVDFFIPRIPSGGIIICDNLDWYDHEPVAKVLEQNGFLVLMRMPHSKAVGYKRK